MKKSMILVGMLSIGYATAQTTDYEGRVGINTDEPKATLDVKATNTDKAKGILTPQVSGNDLKTMTGNLTANQHGMISFATSGVTTADNATENVQFSGYHRFNIAGTEKSWVRLEPSGLEKIKGTGTNIGWRLIPFEKRNGIPVALGNKAVDLSNLAGDDSARDTYSYGASGSYSVAMNHATLASGFASTAIGYKTKAAGAHSFASGSGSNASGSNSVALGQQTVSNHNNTFAIGYRTTASGNNSAAFGESTVASGSHSFVAGNTNNATGTNSAVFGNNNNATAAATFVAGAFSKAEAYTAMAIGFKNTASGVQSFAGGSSNIASGENSFAFGNGNKAEGITSIALGFQNTVKGDASLGVGIFSTTDTKTANSQDRRMFNIGNGWSNDNRSDAFTVLNNGKVGINIDNFETTTNDAKLQVNGKILANSLAGTGNRPVYADENGVLVIGTATTSSSTGATTLTGDTGLVCNATNRGKMNFIPSTDNTKSDVFGICMRNKDGNYYWAYMVGGNNPTNGTGAFGSGL